MNYLIKAYLSQHDEKILPGCIFSETVRTNPLKLNEQFLLGVKRSKRIHHFASLHPSYLVSRKRLNLKYFKHSETIIGIFYDHFLASNWNRYSNTPLGEFSEKIYQTIEAQKDLRRDFELVIEFLELQQELHHPLVVRRDMY